MEMSNICRIEIDSTKKSSEAKVLENALSVDGHEVSIETSKVYTVEYDFSEGQFKQVAAALHNPITEFPRINEPADKKFDFVLELGLLPGVTDNVANTTTEIINDLFKIEIGRNKVFSSKLLFISGNVTKENIKKIALGLTNVLIERHHIKSYTTYLEDGGMDKKIPTVHLKQSMGVLEIDLDVGEEELIELGKKGIFDPETNARRGPLALSIDYLKSIKEYYEKEGRKPTDIELESIAQTWSEHCKHTIFASQIDDIEEGIFKRYIKKATENIRKDLGDKDFCLSVFKDNSGGIIFNEEFMITDKAETHNSPSALDPFGGAITGIVGVNRDTLGFGMGALPIANKYGYCFGKPEDKKIIFRGEDKTSPALAPRRIMDGVVQGVNVGGNCSGIPTPTGFVFFDDNYKGKPLVFVGTIGLLSRKLPNGKSAEYKKARPGDNIVIIGGRVGKDGIHGATFSSEEMDGGSPATAVQIGDPITQKKFSDAIAKEAIGQCLYNSITDNGAGGMSCSVAEMAKECGGFVVDLEKVPLKYPGLQPWEIWISESQERMTLSVPDSTLEEFMDLMRRRGVEATAVGRFNDTNRAVVNMDGKKIFDLEMDFLHEGLPKKKLVTKPYPYQTEEPAILVGDQKELFLRMIGSHNICSYEYISKQYDHEVQNNSVIKPLQGEGRVNGNSSVIKPIFGIDRGVVVSQALFPRMSEINCYDMAGVAIDSAIRNAVAVGGDINHMALMDNFCWCSSDEPERLCQLKDSARGCYEFATAYKTPFISGKDSMFNDFKGFDDENNQIKISAYPTLMISSIGVIENVQQSCSIDFKIPGDLVYIIGETKDECGGSEFYNLYGEIGSKSPKVDAKHARKLYEKMYEMHTKGIFSACSSIERGGLLTAIAKMSIAGCRGVEIDLTNIPGEDLPFEKKCYSESQSRFIVSIDPTKKESFENGLQDFEVKKIGEVKEDMIFMVKGSGTTISTTVEEMNRHYKQRFGSY